MRKFFWSSLIAACPLLLAAQGSINYLPANLSLIPPSPDVSAINKYIDLPVNAYAGIPSISLPIYTIKVGKRTVPITLSYHAGGIKPEENASWVGLGWTLNAGGNVSRTLNGLADEEPTVGFLNQPEVSEISSVVYRPEGEYHASSVLGEDKVVAYALGILDAEPDIFYFTAGEKSGKFILDKSTKQANLFVHDKVKITHSHDFSTWTVVNSDGVTYFYSQQEVTNSSNAYFRGPNKSYVSAWLLEKITYPDCNESIEFIYDDYSSLSYNGFSETDYYRIKHEPISYTSPAISCYFSMSEFLGYSTSKNRNAFTGKFLSKIIFPEGSIVFNKNEIEIDPKRWDYIGSKYLKNIQVLNKADAIIAQYNFSYAYFGPDGEIPVSSNNLNYENVRLKLLKLEKTAGTLNEEYKFEYNNINLPSKFTLSKDHWGLFNGKPNTSLLPEIYVPWYNNLILSGSDRNASNDYAKAGMLKKIIYPTGGYSEYDFESNDCESAALPDNAIARNLALTGTAINTTQSVQINLINRPNIQLTMQVLPVIPASCVLKIKITKPTGEILTYTYSTMHQNVPELLPISLWLPTGSYSVNCTVLGNTMPTDEVFVNFSWSDEVITHKKLAGGIRVKKTTLYDPIANKSLVKKYTYTTDFTNSSSSGHLFAIPKYDYFYKDKTTEYITRTSMPNNDLTYTQGSPVGYSRVLIEQIDENGNNNGEIENFYTSHQFPDYYYANLFTDINPYTSNSPTDPSPIPSFPYTPPIESNDWRRGLLVKSVVYKNATSSRLIASITENKYKYYTSPVSTNEENPVSTFIKLIKANKAFVAHNDKPTLGFYAQSPVCQLSYSDGYGNKVYNIYTGMYSEKISTKETQYDASGNSLVQESFYIYDQNTHNITETKAKNSLGVDRIEKYKYPSTLVSESNDPSGVYGEMLNRNIWNAVVEKLSYKDNYNFLQSEKTNFGFWNNNSWNTSNTNGFILPFNIEYKKLSAPSQITAKFLAYNENGDVTSVSKENNVVVSYLYDYLKTHPIAQAINASNLSISATSFEADGKGNWDWASGGVVAGGITGKKSFNLNGNNITRTGLNSSTAYTVTYWSRNGSYSVSGTQATYPKSLRSITIGSNTWTLYEHLVTGITSLTISGSGTIDEMRLYPKDAQMTTYTYEPLIGMSSQCDVNNKISYYEYDGFNRLLRIRDQDNNIIKSFDYKYQQTP